MALLTKGLKKGAGKRTPGYKGGGGTRQIKKQIPGTKPGQQKIGPGVKKTTPVSKVTGGGYTPGVKPTPGGGGTKTAPVKIKTKPIPGRKPAPGSRVKPGGPAVKPNRGAQIAAKKKVFAQKRANKLANQKKLAARKRGLAKKRRKMA
jgi:hypothetical protein